MRRLLRRTAFAVGRRLVLLGGRLCEAHVWSPEFRAAMRWDDPEEARR